MKIHYRTMLFFRAHGTPLTDKTTIIKLYIIYIYWSCTMARGLQDSPAISG